jgi:tetratricopeptide (TPR) repeat protein
MISWRHPYRVALALFAFGVLGSSLAFACMFREDNESVLDVIRTDIIAGATAQSQLQFAEAEQHYRRVVAATETPAVDGSFDPTEYVWALVQLGDVLENEGQIGEADRCYTRALQFSRLAVNPYGESSILALSHLRDLCVAAGDSARAVRYRAEINSIANRVEPLYLNAIALQRKVKKRDGSVLANKLLKLANLYYERGDMDLSEPLYAEVFAIRSRKGAAGGGDVVGPLIRMGLASADAGKYAAATAMLKETLAERESQYGPKSPYLIKNLYDLGMVAYRRGRLEEADSLLSRALTIEEDHLGLDHPYSAPVLASLAECNMAAGKLVSARAYQLRLINIRNRVYGTESRLVAAGLLALAEIEAADGDRVSAREMCEEALDVAMKASGAGDPLTVECEKTLRLLSRYTPETKVGMRKSKTQTARG